MKIKCKLVAENNACGWLSSDKGAIMIESNTAGEIVANADTRTVASNTYTFTKANWTLWKGNKANLNAGAPATAVQNTSEADPFFNYFYCGGSRDHTYTCYKYMPAVSSDGDPRFDKDSSGVKALGYLTSGAALEEKSVSLTGAIAGATSTLALVAGILAISFQ